MVELNLLEGARVGSSVPDLAITDAGLSSFEATELGGTGNVLSLGLFLMLDG